MGTYSNFALHGVKPKEVFSIPECNSIFIPRLPGEISRFQYICKSYSSLFLKAKRPLFGSI